MLAIFVGVSAPPERQPRTIAHPTYSTAALETALARHGFEAHLAGIAAAGSRVTGTPGCQQVEALVSNAFQRAGLEVLTQEFEVTIPVTEVCEIRDAATGQPLEGVRLFPFLPAGLMPISCTLTSRLVTAESAALQWLSGHDPRDVTVVTTVSGGASWASLAAVGAPALIVRTDPAQQALLVSPDQPANWNGLVSAWEHPFPLFYATGPIESCAGRLVTITCRVVWQPRPARNVLGVLRGRNAQHAEALVISAYLDSSSVVPDLAPGAEQSIPLASMLDVMQALAPYRDELSRDLIFAATAGHAQSLAGVSQLMEAIETFSASRPGHQTFEVRRAAHVAALQAVADDPALIRTAAGEIHLQRREQSLAARLAYLRAGSPIFRDGFDPLQASAAERKLPVNRHPLLDDYLRAKGADNEAADLVGAPAARLLERPDYRVEIERLRTQTAAWQTSRIRQLDDLIRVRDLFAPYRHTLNLNLELTSGGSEQREILSLLVGIVRAGPTVEPQVSDIANLLMAETPGLRVLSWGAADAEGNAEHPNRNSTLLTELESEAWFLCGRLGFSLCNHEFIPGKLGTPEDLLADLNLAALRTHVPAAARLALALAGGQVEFKTISTKGPTTVLALRGTVYGDAGAATVVPGHPMGRRTVVRAVPLGDSRSVGTPLQARGITAYAPISCGPDGAYARPITFDFSTWSTFNMDAARFDAAGRVCFFGDTGAASQSVYPSVKLKAAPLLATVGRDPQPVNVGLFRCAPVALYPCVNPQTQQPFKEQHLLTRQGLTEPERLNQGGITAFLEPDMVFHASFMDGTADNPEILTPRAFMLNVADTQPVPPGEPELEGRGYLAADTPVIAWPHLAAADSMLRTAEKRLRLQRRYHMADEQMLGVHARGAELLREARAHLTAGEPLAAANAGAGSLAYAMANHPVIRGRITQAVVGILWYLGLLVPFVFFAEKLLFGFPDIRKQLVAVTVIFLVVFSLLRGFHPAFQMVRSSLMILLGFITLLLSLLVTAMVGGKFNQNLKDLRRREGQVEGADVNRSGVIGTAFMLGLNNMRRRKVRTGLTCGTLILITFVMICFTSVSTDLVDVEYPTGRSPWNGIMVRNEHYVGMSGAQISTLQQIYGSAYPVATIRWLTPVMDSYYADRLQNPEVQVERIWSVGDQAISRRTALSSAVEMRWNEPAFSGIDACLLTHRGWFPRPAETPAEIAAAAQRGVRDVNYVILPEAAARELGLAPEIVDATNVVVTIRGSTYEVLGIFDPAALARIQGLDGHSLLPFDVNSVQQFGNRDGKLVVPEDIARLDPSQVMLVNGLPPLKFEEAPTVYCSILFPSAPYTLRADYPRQPAVDFSQQDRLVGDYLERLGQPAYYAKDGTAYYGSRHRSRSLAGLLQLLVPLLIAALTVFNTMRGSVYERRGEIFVYNAVGIAPNHVFFMFMAEACVYAVVGALCGYVLSQAMGRALTAAGLTGGLNLDYSSIETIYASLAIMVAVLLSTLLPARDAARMASPSGMTGWTLPKAEGDDMEFNLPFTFTPHDRVAVVSYFRRWLDANGAGSSGPFYCSPPEAMLKEDGKIGRLEEWKNGTKQDFHSSIPVLSSVAGGVDPGAALVPALRSTVWLKPYDLGVSQTLEISLPSDPETKEFIAHIRLTRQSGNTAAWQRTVKPFLGALRKQFLHWRVTTPADRTEMFAEARQFLSEQARKEMAHG